MNHKEKKYSKKYVDRLRSQIANLKNLGSKPNGTEQKDGSKDKDTRLKKNPLEIARFIVNLLLAVGTIIIAFYAVNQSNIAKESAKSAQKSATAAERSVQLVEKSLSIGEQSLEIQKESMEIINRAYITVFKPKVISSNLDSFFFEIKITNTGKTPAFIDKNSGLNIHFSDSTKIIGLYNIVPKKNDPIDTPLVIGPNITITINTGFYPPSAKQQAQILSNNIFIYIQFYIVYKDVFNKDRITNIFLKYYLPEKILGVIYNEST